MSLKRKIKNFLIYINRNSVNPTYFHLEMTSSEKDLFEKILKKSISYIEYGMGGSTILALTKSQAKICSIESSESWCEEMRKFKIIRDHENGRLTIRNIAIGETKEWGYPVSTDNSEKFSNYSKAPYELEDLRNADLILVDGRFRVACCLMAILKCNSDVRIFVHDYSKRISYNIIEKYCDIVDFAETLYLFKPKKNINIKDVLEDYNKYSTMSE
jgi:hypothetical protein